MSISLPRVSLVSAMAAFLWLVTPIAASADVLVNEWQPWGSVNFTSNSCDPSEGLIDLFGAYHRVVIELRDGTQLTHIWQYLTGTDAAGNLYHAFETITLSDPPGSDFSSVVRGRLISQGPTDNYQFTITYSIDPPIYDIEVSCRG